MVLHDKIRSIFLILGLLVLSSCANVREKDVCKEVSAVQPCSEVTHYAPEIARAPVDALLKALNLPPQDTLAHLIELTQKQWLRPVGIERWEIEDSYKSKREHLFQLLRAVGAIDEITPCAHAYDYAIFFGSRYMGMKKRLAYLVHLWQRGITFENIIFLSGERYVTRDEIAEFANDFEGALAPKTEYELARFLYKNSLLPADLRKIPTTFINSLGHVDKKGTFMRPTTESTIKEWAQSNPVPGSVLAISSQPFVKYQHAVLQRILPDTFRIETVGQAVSGRESISIILDSIARYFYQFRR